MLLLSIFLAFCFSGREKEQDKKKGLAAIFWIEPKMSAIMLKLVFLATYVQGLALTVSTTGGNASSPLLYGLMFEVFFCFLLRQYI